MDSISSNDLGFQELGKSLIGREDRADKKIPADRLADPGIHRLPEASNHQS